MSAVAEVTAVDEEEVRLDEWEHWLGSGIGQKKLDELTAIPAPVVIEVAQARWFYVVIRQWENGQGEIVGASERLQDAWRSALLYDLAYDVHTWSSELDDSERRSRACAALAGFGDLQRFFDDGGFAGKDGERLTGLVVLRVQLSPDMLADLSSIELSPHGLLAAAKKRQTRSKS